MVGMDEALVAEWVVVNLVLERMERSNRVPVRRTEDSAWQVKGKEWIARRTAERVKLMPAGGAEKNGGERVVVRWDRGRRVGE